MKVVGEKYNYADQSVAPTPTYLLLESTNRCNLRCPTCSRETLTNIGAMTYERFLDIVHQFPDLKTVKLHGLGETFLAKDIMKMLHWLDERDIETVIVTNGNWKRRDHAEILDRLDFLYFSVDGFDKPTYEEARPGGIFEKVVHNIQEFVSVKTPHNGNILINFVCQGSNMDYLPKMTQLAIDLGVNALRINVMQSWVSKDDFPDQYEEFQKMFVNDVDTFTEYYKQCLQIAAKHDFDVEVIGNENFEFNQCIWPFERAYVTWDGELVPCCMRPDPIYSIGNILKDDLKTVWNRPKLHAIRSSLAANNPYSFCKGCPYKSNANFLKEVKARLADLPDYDFSLMDATVKTPQILRTIRYVGSGK